MRHGGERLPSALAAARSRKSGDTRYWLYGLHAVRAALANDSRRKYRLLLTPGAKGKLAETLAESGMDADILPAARFSPPLDADIAHQGAALLVAPLTWDQRLPWDQEPPEVETDRAPLILVDRVSDPHNAGAIVRSAAMFGARAVITPRRHSASESGALAKAASGALERMPVIRVGNLAQAMEKLRRYGFALVGLDGAAEENIADVCAHFAPAPLAFVLGAEGRGLRTLTRARCDRLARIPAAGAFASLNVSNAAAIALYAAQMQAGKSGGENPR